MLRRSKYSLYKRSRHIVLSVLFSLVSVMMLFPFAYMLCNSFMSPAEILRYYQPDGTAQFHVIPDSFSLTGWSELLQQDFLFKKFVSSVILSVIIVFGQMLVSCLGGFAFAKYKFKGDKWILSALVLLAMMPIQVVLVPNYIVLDKMNLIDSWWTLILPSVFLPFGTLLMTVTFQKIPNELIEAARIDGAGTWTILWRILVPVGKGGFISLLLLSFIDAWNMVEQPMTFLHDISAYPLSVFLATAKENIFPIAFACGALAALPVLLLFFLCNKQLSKGIEISDIK
ncbi:MAG: carbohydrate ABC transporter permease [Syntrophomonadaceae bacterium]|nr:carbohydrate ABC transporter permease [Syntrophomonadaceae bacterium]